MALTLSSAEDIVINKSCEVEKLFCVLECNLELLKFKLSCKGE